MTSTRWPIQFSMFIRAYRPVRTCIIYTLEHSQRTSSFFLLRGNMSVVQAPGTATVDWSALMI